MSLQYVPPINASPWVEPPPKPVRAASEREMDFGERLQQSSVKLACFHRELPDGLGICLEKWAEQFPAQFDEVLTASNRDFTAATRGIVDPFRTWIVADIERCQSHLAELSGAPRLRVFFGAVRTDQCRKFHVDYVRYRLVTTYVGPGTEWLPEHAVNRSAMAYPWDCPIEANRNIVLHPAAVRRATAGEVIVMKGALHPDGLGAVHRSPPIESSGQVRVVLIVTTVDEP